VKRTGKGEPVGVVIHICMETTQGNFLCSYLFLQLAKVMFLFYVSSTKSEEGGTGVGWAHDRSGEVSGKGVGG
jgi:hypothetical protein